MATINHKKYDEATETFKDFNVYDGKETLIFKVDGEAGNVGIGTSAPFAPLDVNSGISSSSGTVLVLSQNTDGAIKGAASLGISVGNSGEATNAADLWFRTANGGSLSERMRITSAGNVGIGTNNPSAKLDITASPSAYTGALRLGVETDSSEGNSVGISFKTKIALSASIWENARIATITESVSSSVYGALAFSTMNATTLSEKMRITPTGNVVVGGTTAGTSLNRSVTVDTASAGDYSGLIPMTAGVQRGYYGASSTGLEIGVSDNKYLSVWTNGAQRLRVDADGLKFGTDTAAANALDDYEEGTFTPTYAGGLTGVTYSTRYGSYTKIGNRVMFDLRIQATSVAGTSGSLVIGGLPFATNGAVISNATIGYFGVYTTDIVYCLIDTSAVDAILFYQKDATPLLGSELTADTSAIHLSGVYFV